MRFYESIVLSIHLHDDLRRAVIVLLRRKQENLNVIKWRITERPFDEIFIPSRSVKRNQIPGRCFVHSAHLYWITHTVRHVLWHGCVSPDRIQEYLCTIHIYMQCVLSVYQCVLLRPTTTQCRTCMHVGIYTEKVNTKRSYSFFIRFHGFSGKAVQCYVTNVFNSLNKLCGHCVLSRWRGNMLKLNLIYGLQEKGDR